MIWGRVPFLRILSPFVLGILMAELGLPFGSNILWVSIALWMMLLVLGSVKRASLPFQRQWMYGLLLNLALFTFAWALSTSQSSLTNDAHFSKYLASKEQGFLLQVISPVKEKAKSIQVEVDILQVSGDRGWIKTLGKALVYFEKDTNSQRMLVGDRLLAYANLERVQGPRNPGAFDYAAYLSRSDLFFRAYLSSKSWKTLRRDEGLDLLNTITVFKDNLQASIHKLGLTEEAYAVISALTLGDKDELSPELKSAYSKAGVLHILAVSGLHVGIIYLVLNFLLSFLNKVKKGPLIKAVGIILLLWGYAMLTGMSPSVSRAATMFSFVIIGSSLNKYTNIYNTLCVSAFFLLLFQPSLLFNVGFLLSYTAVVGIVFLYPRIYGSLKPKNWILDKVWVLLSVSLAAQIATFPLSLHYFHQFPNYFLVANLVVVPLATCVIYLALLLFAISPFEILAEPLATGINYVVQALNWFVGWIEQLPYAVADGIEIDKLTVIAIYGVIGLLIAFIETGNRRFLFSTLTLVLLMGLNQVIVKHAQSEQTKLIVYDISKHSAYDVINGWRSTLTLDSSLVNDERALSFAVENNWRQLGIADQKMTLIEKGLVGNASGLFSVINSTRILFPAEVGGSSKLDKIQVDILILSNKCNASIKQLTEVFEIGEMVLDSSIPKYKLAKLLTSCKRLSIPVYSVGNSGAFVRDL